MRNPFHNERTGIDDEIKAVLDTMSRLSPVAEGYKDQMDYLERLYELKTHERRRKVDSETMAKVGGNLALGLMIVVFEQRGHAITSRTFGFLKGS